jgi:acyl-CoA synthetase (AMP-forming)/AMP-acid ligase II
MSPEMVRRYAALGLASGWRFFVMYGQTEASPRMAYLPPELAASHPGCIGVPIPGGSITLLDEASTPVDAPDTPGELAYAGPNVMMGYARSPDELASDETPPYLLTGDLACRNAAGLFYIVGRTSRFVKPFGVRIDLDRVEARARERCPSAVAAGTDSLIVVAVLRREIGKAADELATELSAAYGLPKHSFRILAVEALPRLANQKPDYQSMLAAAGANRSPGDAKARTGGLPALASVVLSPDYARQFAVEALRLLGLAAERWDSVADVYRSVLGAQNIVPGDSFTSLAGDSLSYVQVELILERLFDRLPPDWPQMTVRELEDRRAHEAV